MQLSDAFLDDLVRRITDERSDVFGAFYTPYLRDGAQRVAGLAASLRSPDAVDDVADLAGVAESALRSLMGLCVETGVRTLIASFRAQDTGYEAFHARLAQAPGRQAVLDRFPELDRLLRLATARTARTVSDVLHAAVADRAELDALLGGPGRIVSVTPGLGDAHRGGRTVCLVVRDDGSRTVYKPQQDNCQQLLTALRTLLDTDGSFFGPLHPRTLVRPAHVWQEFVVHADLDGTAEHSARYFRRFGRSAALLSMLGATDLHHENIIATPDGPVVIDTETLVSLPNSAVEQGASIPAAAALNLDIERSVLNTLLFPARYAGAKLDVDISGIGCVRPGASESLQSYLVVDAGTDDIRFDRSQVVVEHGGNMATVAGEPLDPRRWTDELVAGFREARTLLAAHRDAVEAAVRDSAGWAVRQVVRPTYVYARFLEASTHPVHLGSRQDRAELLGKLPRHYRGTAAESADAVHREEVAALLDLDVPFFTVDCDSGLLRGDFDEEIRSAARLTPRESALAAVGSFFARPADRDPLYLRYALAGSADDVWERRDPAPGSAPAASPVHLADPAGWHALLRDLVVGEADAPTWLTPRLRGDGLRLGGVDAALYDGGGLLLHLAQEAARTGTAPVGVDPERVCASAARSRPAVLDGTPLSMSPFTGALSDLVTDWEIRRLAAPGARFRAGEEHVRFRPAQGGFDVDGLSAADFDHLNGYGGYLVHLAAHTEHGATEVTGAGAERLLRRLVTVDGDPAEPPEGGELGLAHGRFGRITALSAMVAAGLDEGSGARAHLERFAEAYGRHRWQDAGLRDRGTGAGNSGWCKGYAGIAYAHAALLAALGEPAGRIAEAVAPEIDRVLEPAGGAQDTAIAPDLSLCHGLAGRIAVLCHLADLLARPDLRDGAAALHTAFVDRYGKGGWSCGIGTEPLLPSYFLGLSGWFAAQAMLDHPGTGLPRCLGGR
ncbi:type 2 lanthipeptide synthetase LanM [Streptomyces sp. CNS654]|uniref:type 2 lanthipeptide synthetase LanM n=1 Tax=Streptomyces sp. CNS654 TaxID=1506995 RepID=UPI0009968CEA|nr:type 2 lanthipeptide synthetase LanM [Streptomyces sp. CNS654]